MHSLPRRIINHHWLLLLVIIIPVLSLSAGCSGNGMPDNQGMKLAPISQLPADMQKAPTTVRQAYQFAVSNPDALKNVPCYCGCGAAGHTSNYSCYIKEVKPTGEITFDQHALGCSICVDISQDVMRLTKNGKSPGEIRAAIDQTYSKYGPSNMAPVQ
jgi:hypothetical protein